VEGTIEGEGQAHVFSLHFSPTVVAKRRRGRWMQGLRPRPRRRIQGEEFMLSGVEVLRRPTERNVAGADVSGDAAESR
jgi:hypothetical protein